MWTRENAHYDFIFDWALINKTNDKNAPKDNKVGDGGVPGYANQNALGHHGPNVGNGNERYYCRTSDSGEW
jgi:hypothetical protein